MQHRIAAWKAGFEIIRDHPFGVGWNNTLEIYDKGYSPPDDGAMAITTNDYLMLGTQLGIPAFVCFLAYVALCFKSPKPKVPNQGSAVQAKSDGGNNSSPALGMKPGKLDSTQVACRAGALAMLVTFAFDDGLFLLPSAAVFWTLLELGSERRAMHR